jgi:hypothetical protein
MFSPKSLLTLTFIGVLGLVVWSVLPRGPLPVVNPVRATKSVGEANRGLWQGMSNSLR